MSLLHRWARSLAARLILAFALIVAVPGAASAASYVTRGVGVVTPEQKVAVPSPQPVQLVFSFVTSNQPNPKATKLLKERVTAAVRASGVFSEVSDAPVASGATLTIVIHNHGDMNQAVQSGVVTGLTFGLAGSQVSDLYDCTLDFKGGPDAAKITKTLRHELITTIGIKSAPPNVDKAKNATEGIYTIVDQSVARLLNDLASDQTFNPAAPPPAPAAPVVAEPAAPAAEPVAPAQETPPEPAAAPGAG